MDFETCERIIAGLRESLLETQNRREELVEQARVIQERIHEQRSWVNCAMNPVLSERNSAILSEKYISPELLQKLHYKAMMIKAEVNLVNGELRQLTNSLSLIRRDLSRVDIEFEDAHGRLNRMKAYEKRISDQHRINLKKVQGRNLQETIDLSSFKGEVK